MNDETSCRSLESLVEEGEKLLVGRPFCHKMQNDLTALAFTAKLHHHGYEVSFADAEQCLRRLRITIDTGIYPDKLLNQASAARSLTTA